MSAFWKDLFREIRNSLGRFFSMLIITALGAASIVGIAGASIDMRDIADSTYKEHNLYDLQIKSSTGFSADDLVALQNAEGVARIMPTTIFDVFVNIENVNRAVRTYALPEGINTVDLVEGRLPENARECVVERSLLRDSGVKIGDSIRLGLDDMDDYFKVFDDDSFTVVGVVSSPLYISFERGNTTLGDGSLRYYLYLHPDTYKLDVFTDVYVLMDGSQAMDNLTQGYYDAADGWERQVKTAGDVRVREISRELTDAQREIDDGWDEYYDGVKTLDEEISDARGELENAAIKLADAKVELENGQKTLDAKIEDARAEIDRNSRELAKGQDELNARGAELTSGQAQLDEARGQLEAALAELELQGPQGVSPTLDAYYEEIFASLGQLDAQQAQLDEGKAALVAAQKELDDGAAAIISARAELEAERKKAQAGIDDGWSEYYTGLDEYNDGVVTLEREEADGLAKLADAKTELEDAQEKLDDAPAPEWFYFTREAGGDFDSYYQDTLRLEKIGYVFPLVFFLVAVMVSLTSMSRMVEEHRTQIGIYKALGYRPGAIMLKYVIYAFFASLLGGVAGVLFGSRLFPVIIADAYGHMYDMPPINTPVPMNLAIIAVFSAVAAVVIVTLGTYLGSMRGHPAFLMRPKPPAKGKRVWLERVGFIWRRLGFFNKVTARNVFRYKRRFIMTLAGVAGCSALLLTAFGLSDSIAAVATLQFDTIVQYDARAYLKDIDTERQRLELEDALPEGHLFIREESVTASGVSGGLSASLIIPDAPEGLNDYFNLYSPFSGETVEMTSRSVLLTEKLARVMGVEANDRFTITLNDGRAFSAVATGIVDNYVLHSVYIAPEIYAELFGVLPAPNSVLLHLENGQLLPAPLLKNENVRAIIYTDDLMSQVGDSTDAMEIVTLVLIVLACALALVVLFNLTNINISERIRELATIKVLGFNDGELAMYIYRENGLVTLIGIALGLVGGIFLHSYVLTSVEIDILKFPKIIHPQSYVYAVLLSVAFAVFVNIVMSFKLRRIDMVESLKNVE